MVNLSDRPLCTDSQAIHGHLRQVIGREDNTRRSRSGSVGVSTEPFLGNIGFLGGWWPTTTDHLNDPINRCHTLVPN